MTAPETPDRPVDAAHSIDPQGTTVVIPDTVERAVVLEPVAVGAQPGRPRNRLRWGVALALVALIALVSTAAFVVLAAGASASSLVGFAPRDSVVYLEVRTDLPGDQGQKLADLMARFPGFADRAALESKIAEAIDQQLAASGAGVSYSRDIKPWLSGEVALAVPARAVEAGAGGTSMPLILLATRDPAAGLAFLARITGDRPSQAQTIGGLPFTVVGTGDGAVAYGASGTTILVGSVDSVAAGLTAKQQGGLSQTEGYAAARTSLPGDHLAFGYLDYRSLMTMLMPSQASGATVPAALLARLSPPWLSFAVSAQGDALVMEAAAPNTRPALPATSTSTLAARLPSSTIVEVEYRDVGAEIAETLALYRTIPQFKTTIDALDEEARTTLGGDLAGLTGWIGDAAFVVTREGIVFSGGLVVEVRDAAAAQALATRLRSLLEPRAASAGVRVREESFGSGTIVVYEPAAPGTTVPFLPGGSVQVAWSLQDNLLVIGLGPEFVKSVLKPTPGATLADQPAYRSAIAKAGSPNAGQVYVDLASIVSLADMAIPIFLPQSGPSWAGVKPFLVPLQAVAASTTVEGDVLVYRVVVTVK